MLRYLDCAGRCDADDDDDDANANADADADGAERVAESAFRPEIGFAAAKTAAADVVAVAVVEKTKTTATTVDWTVAVERARRPFWSLSWISA